VVVHASSVRRLRLVLVAVWADDLSAVQELLADSENVQKELNLALTKSWPEVALSKRCTALHMAVAFASWPIVEALLAAGADPNCTDSRGFDVVMYGCVAGATENVKRWAQLHGANWDINRREPNIGLSAIHFAVLISAPDKSVELINILVEAGADLHQRPHFGGSLLQFLCFKREARRATYDRLLEDETIRSQLNDSSPPPMSCSFSMVCWGARCVAKCSSHPMLQLVREFSKGCTALHYAVYAGNAVAVQALLEAKADPEHKVRSTRLTPLQFSSRPGSLWGDHVPPAVKQLFEKAKEPETTEDDRVATAPEVAPPARCSEVVEPGVSVEDFPSPAHRDEQDNPEGTFI